jgi:hypothetical protein
MIRAIFAGTALTACVGCHRGPAANMPKPAVEPPRFVVERIPANAIVGRVVDDSLDPIVEARVLLDNNRTVSTDRTGRFELLGVAPGRHRVRVLAFGHRSSADDVELVDGTGSSLVAELPLRVEPLIEVCVGTGQSAVVVRLLPVRLLSTPGSTFTTYPRDARVLISSGSTADSIAPDSTTRDSQGRLVARSNLERAGTYSVEVSAPGFVIWRRTGITVGTHTCGIDPVTVDVQLKRATGPE